MLIIIVVFESIFEIPPALFVTGREKTSAQFTATLVLNLLARVPIVAL